jgi:hypothetical protein
VKRLNGRNLAGVDAIRIEGLRLVQASRASAADPELVFEFRTDAGSA